MSQMRPQFIATTFLPPTIIRAEIAETRATKETAMVGVNPYISFKGNCREAVEFYKSALNAEVLFIHTVGESPMPDMGPADNIMHCTIQVGKSVIMMSDDPRPESEPTNSNISLAVGLNDPALAQQLFDNLSAGGTIIMPITKTYWAEAFGMLTDKFGVKWMINSEAPRPSKSA